MKESFFASLLKGLRDKARLANIGERTIKWDKTVRPLMSELPDDKQHKVVRKMATILLSAFVSGKPDVNNFDLAECLEISPQYSKANKKIYGLSRKRYQDEIKRRNQQIENCFRTLKRYWNPLGYNLEFNKHSSRLIKIV